VSASRTVQGFCLRTLVALLAAGTTFFSLLAPAGAATPICVQALCLWTGASYSGNEIGLRGSVPDLSKFQATRIGSLVNGDTVCWWVFDRTNYAKATYEMIVPPGNHTPSNALSGVTWLSVERSTYTHCT